MVSPAIDTEIHVAHSCHFTSLDSSDRHDNTPCTACTSEAEIKTELFEVGETLIYTKDGHTAFVKVVAIQLDKK